MSNSAVHREKRPASMRDKRYTLHSFRVGGGASRYIDGTAMGVLVEYI